MSFSSLKVNNLMFQLTVQTNFTAMQHADRGIIWKCQYISVPDWF